MSEESSPPPKTIADDWDPLRLVPLDGTLERNSFPPLLTAFVVLCILWVMFQIVGTIVGTVAIMSKVGAQPLLDSLQDAEGMMALIKEYTREMLFGNTVGQFLCIGLAALLFGRMTSSRAKAYLRFRPANVGLILLGTVGVVALLPVVSFLGELWSGLPWSETLRNFDSQNAEIIEAALQRPDSLYLNLFMIAVTPAICEELLFRGYLQRNAERYFGPVGTIIFVGLIFGAYHAQPTKLLPLALLGSYFAYLVWKGGALWPAIVAHFVNNAIAVAIGTHFAQREDFDMAELDNMTFEWYFVVAGLIVFVGSMIYYNRLSDSARKRVPDNRPMNEAIEGATDDG